MIIEAMIDLLFTFLSNLFAPLLDWTITLPTEFIEGFSVIMQYVGFFVPIRALLPLIALIATYYGVRVAWHFVRFILNLIPTVSNS